MIKRRQVLFYVLIFVCFVFVNIIVIDTQSDEKSQFVSGELYEERENVQLTDTFTNPEDVLNQYFKPKKDHLDEIVIRLAVNNFEIDFSDWLINICLYDENDNLIYKEQVAGSDFENWRDYAFKPDQDVAVGSIYRIEIRQIKGYEDTDIWPLSIVCFIAPNSADENEQLFFNQKELPGGIELAYHYSFYGWQRFARIIIWDIIAVCTAVLIGLYCIISHKGICSIRVRKYLGYIIYAIVPIFVFVLVQKISEGRFSVDFGYILRNLILYYIIYFFITFIFENARVSITIYSGVLVFLAAVEYFVYRFRGRSFMLLDFFNIKTAAAVMNHYSFSVPVELGCYLIQFLILITVAFAVCDFRLKHTKKWVLLRSSFVFGVIGCIAVWLNTDILTKSGLYSINLWETNQQYAKEGYLYTLFLQGGLVHTDVPADYSVAKVEEIADEIKADDVITPSTAISPNNIIVIMNEAFSDLRVIDMLETEASVIPYISELQDVSRGYLYVPVFGGGTADTEYEFLTGNTKAFLPAGSVAYQLYCNAPMSGLPDTLKSFGYKTIAVHPHNAYNWNRENVYSNMGFDDFIHVDNWGRSFEYIRQYASDSFVYDKIMDLFDEKANGDKLFVFCVTIQNHGGYSEEMNGGFESTVSLSYDQDYPEAETYLSLLNESDKAFGTLVEHFSAVSEPTMIVMFGDHQADIEQELYEELYGQKLEQLSLEDNEKRYEVPYVIWTNYPQDCTEETMSSNFFGSFVLQKAGIPLTVYDQFLLELKEQIPVVSGTGAVCDAEGVWYPLNSLPGKYEPLINDYRILQYNNVFDKKNLIDDIFAFG